MKILQAVGRFFDRLIAVRLQRLPFYRGQADKLLLEEEEETQRTPRTAYETEWPPLKSSKYADIDNAIREGRTDVARLESQQGTGGPGPII